MPRNLELKARCPSLRWAARVARSLGARRIAVELQSDTYFAHVVGGRLKLREINGATSELIFYRRPDKRSARTSDYVKVRVTEPRTLRAMLRDAFGVSCVVRKQRAVFVYRKARIHLDRVRHLGSFIEFELPVGGQKGRAKALMRKLTDLFEIPPSSVIGTSYSDMLFSRTRRKGKR